MCEEVPSHIHYHFILSNIKRQAASCPATSQIKRSSTLQGYRTRACTSEDRLIADFSSVEGGTIEVSSP